MVSGNPTLVLGASSNELRYSNKAIRMLVDCKLDVYAVGRKKGEVYGVTIQNFFPKNILVDTLSIYLNISHQHQYIESIIGLSPNRVIFNPGTENPKLFNLLVSMGIKCENSCTLVLLSTNQY
jgi:hypothetical protein|tara:strand:- start:3135 stop:3503 length:369 start_codon:yes stop_codon:yes gene_type:complete